jgi:hypothetical protein
MTDLTISRLIEHNARQAEILRLAALAEKQRQEGES